MGRRTLLLIAAFLIAALGTAGVYLYVNGVDQRAKSDNARVQILVAVKPIEAGTTASQALLDGRIAPREFLSSSTTKDFRSDLNGIENQVALAPIAAGAPILVGQFGVAGTKSNLPIPKGKLALTIQLDDPERVAPFLVPGAQVTVFASVLSRQGASAGQDVTQVLLQSVRVIGIGSLTEVPASGTTEAGGTTEEKFPGLLTLAVDQTEAQKIAYAKIHGKLAFGLLGDTNVPPAPAGTTIENLFN